MSDPVYLGFKHGTQFLFKKDGDVLINVVKILSIVKTEIRQSKIVKSQQDQNVIQYEDALPMLAFTRTSKFKFFDSDYDALDESHPFTVFYNSFIESLKNYKKATIEQQAIIKVN